MLLKGPPSTTRVISTTCAPHNNECSTKLNFVTFLYTIYVNHEDCMERLCDECHFKRYCDNAETYGVSQQGLKHILSIRMEKLLYEQA